MKILIYTLGVCAANCYLVYDEKSGKACLIDAPEYDNKIMGVISSNSLSLEYIILTHGHSTIYSALIRSKKKRGRKLQFMNSK